MRSRRATLLLLPALLAAACADDAPAPDAHARAEAVRALVKGGNRPEPAVLLALLEKERADEPLAAIAELLWMEAMPPPWEEPPPAVIVAAAPLVLDRYLSLPDRSEARWHLFRLLGILAPHDALAGAPEEIGQRALAAFPRRAEGETEEGWHARLRAAFDDLATRDPYLPSDEPSFIAHLRAPRSSFSDSTVPLMALPMLGTPEGLAAVDAFLARRLVRRPFEMAGRWSDDYVLAKAGDEEGRVFGLFGSIALPGRIVLSRAPAEEGKRWGPEVLTGLRDDYRRKITGLAIRGDELRVSYDSGPDAVLSRRAIRADRDGDGLTDLLEEDLGLCPLLADADGDGEIDGVDPFPLVRPGAMTEEDRIREAVLTFLLCVRMADVVLLDDDVLVQVETQPGALLLVEPHRANGPDHHPTTIGLDIRRDGDRALVYASEHQSGTLGGGIRVFLRKVRGRWYVTGERGDWFN